MRTDFAPFPTLHTERLVLRQPLPTDAESNFHLRTDERVMAFVGRPRPNTVHDAAAMLELLEQDRLAGTRLGWIIALRNDPAMIGTIGLYKLQPEHQLAEVGFQLMHDQWGKGLMREALNAVVSFAFEQLGAHRVEAKTDPRNARTRALLERCGFALEGILRESYYWDGAFLGTAVYGRLQRDGSSA